MQTKDKVKVLKEKLELLESQKELIKTKKETFAKTIVDLVDNSKATELEISELKKDLGDEAIKHFKETKEKTFLGGIKVQESSLITYDKKTAFDWCLEKKMFLTLDEKEFKKVCKSLNLDFVKEETIEKATFPKVIKLED